MVEIEGRMRRVNNYEKLHLPSTAIKSELKQQKVAKKLVSLIFN